MDVCPSGRHALPGQGLGLNPTLNPTPLEGISQHDRCDRWKWSDMAECSPSINALLGAYRWGFE